SYTKDRNATPATRSGFKGVAVAAVSSDSVESYSVGIAASRDTAVQVSFGVVVMNNDTEARIDSSTLVNQNSSTASTDQSVLVTAGSDYFERVITGAVGLSGGGTVVTPSVDVSYLTFDTLAQIGTSAKVSAKRDIDVTAYSEEDL